MADTEQQDGGPSEKESTKPPSPKPDQEVAPPLVSVKGMYDRPPWRFFFYFDVWEGIYLNKGNRGKNIFWEKTNFCVNF